MAHLPRYLPRFLLFCLLSLPALASLANASGIQPILDLKEAPDGVVIEIVTSDDDALEWALPRAQQYVKQLRQRFPQLPIAIVTHGEEMFAMLKSDADSYREVHRGVQSLVKDQDVELHVCGTFAGWKGNVDEDFPEYVNVAAAGPAQINDYVALGYRLVVIGDED